MPGIGFLASTVKVVWGGELLYCTYDSSTAVLVYEIYTLVWVCLDLSRTLDGRHMAASASSIDTATSFFGGRAVLPLQGRIKEFH